jgi:hypothetical protein
MNTDDPITLGGQRYSNHRAGAKRQSENSCSQRGPMTSVPYSACSNAIKAPERLKLLGHVCVTDGMDFVIKSTIASGPQRTETSAGGVIKPITNQNNPLRPIYRAVRNTRGNVKILIDEAKPRIKAPLF